MVNRGVCIFMLTGLVFAAVCSAEEDKPASAPATQQAKAAAAALVKMRSWMERPRAASREEFITALKDRLPKALAVLAEIEQQHPKAAELHEARLMGIVAATQLARIDSEPAMAGRAEGIARKVIASDAPVGFKVNADAHLLLLTLRPVRAATTAPTTNPAAVDTTKSILQFTQRYAKTDQAANAVATGMQIAKIVNDQKAFDELLQSLAKNHSDNPEAKQILRQLGKGPDVGKLFTATLTKLDGTKLTLPDDLLGKVVVIDFWAIWCRPCVVTIPHMRTIYTRYKSEGVEIVGVSLDKNMSRLKAFVATNKMGWVHTFSGKGWADPTTRKYGIGGIPSIWVIGKDGKVVSDNAREDLVGTIEKALAAGKPTTKPAGK